jgi:MoxR-like ATPase
MSDDLQAVEQLRTAHQKLRSELAKIIVGQEAVLDQLLMAIFCRSHALLVGVPGLAKTLMVSTLAQALDLTFKRIQFTPDLMPSDITGTEVIQDDPATGQRMFKFLPGPIFANIVLADEINRTPPKTQAALLEAMQERKATIGGVDHPMKSPFFVLATQNPIEQEGTYPLPEAQLDRFLLKTVIRYPAKEAELEMLAHHEAGFDPERAGDSVLPPLLDAPRAREVRMLVDGVRVAPEVREYITAITRATRDESSLSLGASPRATVALMRAARAAAVLEGRAFVVPDDVKDRVHAALRHRVTLSPELEVEGRSADDVLSAILLRVEAPK